jgi:hypothetical protein
LLDKTQFNVNRVPTFSCLVGFIPGSQKLCEVRMSYYVIYEREMALMWMEFWMFCGLGGVQNIKRQQIWRQKRCC